MQVDGKSAREADEVMTHSHTPLRGGAEGGNEYVSNSQNQARENAPQNIKQHTHTNGKNMETDGGVVENAKQTHPGPLRITKIT